MDNSGDIIKTVRYENSTITLIGTAHVSKKSVELVEETIGNGDFDCIAVELCKPRYEKLTHQTDWKELDIYQIIRQKKATLLLVNLALAAYQKRLADKLGIEPGKEMMRAVELAGEKGVRLELVDRDITTTLNRLVRNVTFWQKMKILAGLVTSIFVDEEIDEKKIEDLKNGDMLHSVVEEFGEELPQVKEVLIDERDEYMAGKLIQLTRLESAPKNILALVGAGHLAGMVQAFSNPADSERMVELDRKKPPSRVGYYVGWGICFVVLSLFYVGYRQSPDLGLQLLLTWVVINGGLSALGAALALGHPLSICTAFVAAPITSLNPTIGAGVLVGLMESYLRKPKVEDFERLRDDVGVFSMWWKNRVIRVLLIFFLANMGSAIGTYVAGASIVTQIFG